MFTEPVERQPDALATPAEAAEFLNLSRTTVYAMLASGDLPSVKIRRSRRIRWSDILRLATEGTLDDD